MESNENTAQPTPCCEYHAIIGQAAEGMIGQYLQAKQHLFDGTSGASEKLYPSFRKIVEIEVAAAYEKMKRDLSTYAQKCDLN